MIITLPPDIEQALAAEARKLGRTPEQLALDSLRERFLSPESDLSLGGEQATLADWQSGGLVKGDHARAPAILAQLVGNFGSKAGLARTARTTEEADGYGVPIVARPVKQLFDVVFAADQGRREARTPSEQVEDTEPIRSTGQVTPGETERFHRLSGDDGLNDDTAHIANGGAAADVAGRGPIAAEEL